MDLRPYIETINRQLMLAADGGGEEARAQAERLVPPLEAAMRLALQDVLAVAAEEITCELAPGSIELRLRGRDPEFVVTLPPAERTAGELSGGDPHPGSVGRPSGITPAAGEPDEGGMARINLRMPDHLKARVEAAAGSEGLSVNAWVVRVTAAAVERGETVHRSEPGGARGTDRYQGWAR